MTIANGVWPTMITPFLDTGEIDYGGVERILEFYAKHGVAGVFAVCQSSEMFYLSLKERVALAKFIASNLPKGMQMVVSGHVHDDVDEQIRQAQEIMCQGAHAYVVLPNRFAAQGEGDDALIERMEQFTKGFDTAPLGGYECPHPYKRLLTPKVLRWCIDSGRFCFIKDTCCDLEQIAEKIDVLKGSGLTLFNANGATLLSSLRLGASGYSGVMANFHPELYAWLCANHEAQPEAAQRMQNFLGTASMAEYQYYPVNAKYYMGLRGVPIKTHSRARDGGNLRQSQQLELQQLEAMSQIVASMI